MSVTGASRSVELIGYLSITDNVTQRKGERSTTNCKRRARKREVGPVTVGNIVL